MFETKSFDLPEPLHEALTPLLNQQNGVVSLAEIKVVTRKTDNSSRIGLHLNKSLVDWIGAIKNQRLDLKASLNNGELTCKSCRVFVMPLAFKDAVKDLLEREKYI